jgi:hypothetical protein
MVWCRRKVLVSSTGEGGKLTDAGKTVMAPNDLQSTKHMLVGLSGSAMQAGQTRSRPGHPNQPTQPNKGMLACWNQA